MRTIARTQPFMDRRALQRGSVASARLMMEKTPRVLLVADGAEEFAKSQGVELVSPYYFYTEREWKRFQDPVKAKEPGDGHGTFGAVALDKQRNIATPFNTTGSIVQSDGRIRMSGWSETTTLFTVPAQ